MTRSHWLLLAVVTAAVMVAVAGCPKGHEGAVPPETGTLPTLQNMVEPTPTTGMPAEGENAVAPGTPGGQGQVPAAQGAVPPGQAPGQAPGQGAAKGERPRTTGIADIDALLKKREALKSYKMVATVDGKTVMTNVVKQAEGRPVRSKMIFGDSGDWILILNDKNERYRYSAQQKVAMKLPSFGNRAPGAPGGQGRQGPGPRGAQGQTAPKGERPQGAPPQGAKGASKGGERPAMNRMRGGWNMDLRDFANSKPTLKRETLDGVACLRVDVKRQDGTNATYWLDTQYGLLRQSKIGDQVTKIKYEEINSVPDSAFELPKGVKVIDAPVGMGFGGPRGEQPRNGGQGGQSKAPK